MQLLIFDDMAQCTDAEVGRLLTLAGLQRREQALRFSHTFGRFCCLKGYELLLDCIERLRHNSDPAAQEMLRRLDDWNGDFVYNEHGKPYLQSRTSTARIEGVEFNISHCKNAVAAVLHPAPVGIDVESFRTASPALIRRTMNDTETEQIHHADNPSREFTRLWTQKEAVLKLEGTGLVDNLPQVLSSNRYRLETIVNEPKGYVYTVATNKSQA